jgi:hypothetical protein
MNGIHEIELNGNKERIRFNQYARAELRKFFMPAGKAYLTETELTQAIIDKWKENDVLLIKIIVYAGIVGDSLVTGFTPRLTQEEVGEFIGSAKDEELLTIWRVFLEAQGFNLSQEQDEQTEKKKKGKTSNGKKKKPLK